MVEMDREIEISKKKPGLAAEVPLEDVVGKVTG
jgi:hypothetical protein